MMVDRVLRLSQIVFAVLFYMLLLTDFIIHVIKSLCKNTKYIIYTRTIVITLINGWLWFSLF